MRYVSHNYEILTHNYEILTHNYEIKKFSKMTLIGFRKSTLWFDSFIDSFIDGSIDWWNGWLGDSFINWSIDWLPDSFSHLINLFIYFGGVICLNVYCFPTWHGRAIWYGQECFIAILWALVNYWEISVHSEGYVVNH